MKKAIVLQFFLCFALISICIGQQQLRIAGAAYNVPVFRTDSTASFTDWYVQLGILQSIKKSAYDLEIRVLIPNVILNFGDQGGCVVIRGNKDSLFATYYKIDMRQGQADGKASLILKDKANKDYDLMLIRHENIAPEKMSSILRGLLANHVTDIFSSEKMRRYLRKNRIKIHDSGAMDCCGDLLYEVKIGNRVRNFTTNALYYDVNPNIKQITFSQNLDYLVTTLINTK